MTTITVSFAHQKPVAVSVGGTSERATRSQGSVGHYDVFISHWPCLRSTHLSSQKLFSKLGGAVKNWLRPLRQGKKVTANLLTTIDFARWKTMPRRCTSPAPRPSYIQQPDLISGLGPSAERDEPKPGPGCLSTHLHINSTQTLLLLLLLQHVSGRPRRAAWFLRVSMQIKRSGPLSSEGPCCRRPQLHDPARGERWRPSKAEPGSGSCAFCPLKITRFFSCMSMNSQWTHSVLQGCPVLVLVPPDSSAGFEPASALLTGRRSLSLPPSLSRVFNDASASFSALSVSVCSPLSPSARSYFIAPPTSRFRPRCTFSSFGGSRERSLVIHGEIKSH